MRFTSLVFLITSSLASGEVVNLTVENYPEKTKGKSVFIKFFAPWCGHCKAMASDWERLAEDWDGHKIGLVAEVDCTTQEELCRDFEVEGYPTLLYGDPSGPEIYEGDRDYEAMSEFAKEVLNDLICSVHNTAACSDEDKAIIAAYEALSLEELKARVAEVEKTAEAETKQFDEAVEKLQREYEVLVEEYNQKVDAVRDNSNYIFLRAVASKKSEEAGIEEEL